MNKIIISVMTALLLTTSGYAGEDQKDLQQKHLQELSATPSKVETEDRITSDATYSWISQTYAVSENWIDGFRFHIADYYDGTRVITCMNGPLLGYQGVWMNGMEIASSASVNWYGNHFVHFYSDGNIDSYSYTQIVKFY